MPRTTTHRLIIAQPRVEDAPLLHFPSGVEEKDDVFSVVDFEFSFRAREW